MTRRLAVVVDQPLIEPTLPDLVAWLRQSPATYLQLLEQAQVATAWWPVERLDGGTDWYRWRGGRGTPEQQCATYSSAVTTPPGYVWQEAGRWRASVLDADIELDGEPEGCPIHWSTREEACAAVDAALTDLGWTLVGGSRG